jgi:hypothetical protein
MTPETFLDQFATFAEAPNGVAKLRELILQLAVQGKLVPQDENDEPASVLVERARKAASTLCNGMKAKRATPLVANGLTTVQEDCPLGWKWTTLGEMGIVSSETTCPMTLMPHSFRWHLSQRHTTLLSNLKLTNGKRSNKVSRTSPMAMSRWLKSLLVSRTAKSR